LRDLYQRLIALRRTETDLADPWLEHLGVDYDEDGQWLVMRRGAWAISCNIGTTPARLPVSGEVVLASDEPIVEDSHMTLPGHSFAISRSRVDQVPVPG
jgi:maltooligosyltrehalose trehalohydrolase